jgi:F0F1-type ATP synthase membrane subunit b/b'
MSNEEEVGLDEKINNTEIKIGKWSFTPAKLMILFTVVSSILGGLYGAFEVYKDYMSMKEAIQMYVAPDLSGIQERMTKLEQKIDNAEKMVAETNDYVGDIRTDLKNDLREINKTVDAADRRNRELERDVLSSLRTIDRETDAKLKELERKVDDKIQKAWENPLAK